MDAIEILKREFDAEDGSFLGKARGELEWDWEAFRVLTSAMYDVAAGARTHRVIDKWIAEGFWFCDTWITPWTSHPNFPRPSEPDYQEATELVHDLAYFFFVGESPYEGDVLRRKAKG
jgi:hypothetical protein